jgi:hypothetical protein
VFKIQKSTNENILLEFVKQSLAVKEDSNTYQKLQDASDKQLFVVQINVDKYKPGVKK